MPWTQLAVAFLAGYGLMSLVLWTLVWLGRRRSRPLTTSAVILAGDEEDRIEAVLRALHGLWEEGRLLEILAAVNGQDTTRAIATRLAKALPGIMLLPEGADLPAALQTARGQTAWVLDMAKIPGTATPSSFLAAGRARWTVIRNVRASPPRAIQLPPA